MRKTLLPVLFAVLVPLGLFAQPDFKTLSQELGKKKLQHPYLIFSAEEKPKLLERIKTDPASAEIMEKMLLMGRRYLLSPVRTVGPERELHTRYVGTDDYRRFVAENMDGAFTLAFLYQMTGDEAYAKKAFEYADVVCAQESWINSAHYFEIIYPRIWPYGAKDDQVVFTYDITASATTRRLSYVYDWLYTAMTKAQRDRIRSALLEKAITRVRGNYEYHWWNTASKCNWSGICHSGLGIAALVLLNEDPHLTDVIAESCKGIWNMIEHIDVDGGWQEGRGYWAFGVGESVMFMDAIKRATDGKINMFTHRSLYPKPANFALFGLTGGFGDGSGTPVGESYVLNKLTQESGDPHAAWYVKNYARQDESIFDLLWPESTVKPEKPAEASKHFRGIDWAFLRKDFGPAFMTIATKAGMNDDPHHGHLDIGTFNLTWQGVTFVGEIPRTPYDEHYFSATRYDYLESRSKGHNVVLVNGEEQIVAKDKDQPWKEGVGGKITQFQSEPAWAYVSMDATRAYPGKELKGWNRWIILDKDTNIVVVLDKVGCAVGSEINVLFHPGVEADVNPDRVVMRPVALPDTRRNSRPTRAPANVHRYSAPDGSATSPGRLGNLEMITLFKGESRIVAGRQAEMPITQEPQLHWVPYFRTIVKAPAQENLIASVFYPSELKGREGKSLTFDLDTSSKTPSVSYTLNGKTVRYVFNGDKVSRATP
jgi:hypothetical protein